MSQQRVFPLEPIRTDGWFERIGEGIGSFQALCDIIGPRFFAFAMITGARIVALTVDRRQPDNTLVDFLVGGDVDAGDLVDQPPQRLTLADFRRRLVSALVSDEAPGPPPQRETDIEALQLHIGVRYLLLAPLYGYSLGELSLGPDGSRIAVEHDGVPEECSLEEFRERLRHQVREELARVSRSAGRGGIELARVQQAEEAALRGDHVRVLELLGSWPAPLAIFLRTPEGQSLTPDVRATIAKGLALLGSACLELGEVEKGEEILRLAIQYAGDHAVAADVYLRLGRSMFRQGRTGEAIGPLRRALQLGAPGAELWPVVAQAFATRGRHLAALAALIEARNAGVPEADLSALGTRLERVLGPALSEWRVLCPDRPTLRPS